MIPAVMAASPSSYDDISGHWAESSIERWSGYGVVNGAGDGLFAPDRTLTRAEAAQIFANLLGLTATASLGQYVDVAVGSWYYDAIAKCVAAGILTGTGGATMSPETVISRQELFVMYARALSIQPQDSADTSFTDSASVASWAAGYINALADMGAIQGGGDGSLDPTGDINRASFVALLDQSISGYANTDNATVGGTSGIVLVVADDVTVMGNVESLVVVGGSAGVSGSSVGTITVTGDNASVSVGGSASVGQVNVTGANAAVTVSGEAAVTTVTVADTAENATVTVNGDATVSAVDSAAAGVTISGTGTVETATVSGDDTTVDTDGTDLTVSQGTTGVTENGNTVAGGDSVTTDNGQTTPEQPSEPTTPVDPPIYVPNYYTVTFVDTTGASISSETVREYTEDISGLAPDLGLADGEQVVWHDGTDYVDLADITVTDDMTFIAVVGSDDFAAGNGTETFPYLVANSAQFAAIGQMSTDIHTYYEQISDIAVTTSNVNFNGTYDGNGYSISAGRTSAIGYYSVFGDVWGDSVIRDLTLMQGPETALTLVSYGAGSSLAVSDIVVDSASGELISINSNNFGFIVANPLYEGWGINTTQKFLFENITVTSNVQVVNLGTCIGMVVGSGPCFNYASSSVTYRNCVNNGTIIGSTYAGLLYGNPSYMVADGQNAAIQNADQFVVENCSNAGTIMATNSNGDSAMCPAVGNSENTILKEAGYYDAQYTISNVLQDVSFAAYSVDSNGFVLSSSEASNEYTYELVFSVSAINWSDGTQSNGIKVIVPATISESTEGMEQFTGSNCHAYDKAKAVGNQIITEDIVNANAEGPYSPYVIVNADGTHKVNIVFLDSAEYDFTSDSSVTLMVYAYDANGVLAGVKQV